MNNTFYVSNRKSYSVLSKILQLFYKKLPKNFIFFLILVSAVISVNTLKIESNLLQRNAILAEALPRQGQRMSQGRNHSSLIIRILQIVILHPYQINTLIQLQSVPQMAFLLGAGVPHLFIYLGMEIFRKIHIVGYVSVDTGFMLVVLKPEMLLSLLQTHPHLLLLQKLTHEVLYKRTVVTPNLILKTYASLKYVGNRI